MSSSHTLKCDTVESAWEETKQSLGWRLRRSDHFAFKHLLAFGEERRRCSSAGAADLRGVPWLSSSLLVSVRCARY